MVEIKKLRAVVESKKFNPEDFKPGDDVVFFDDAKKRWEIGALDHWNDPVSDENNNINVSIITQESGAQDFKLSLSPKKVSIPRAEVEINGKKYQADWKTAKVIQDTGTVEFDLVNINDDKDIIKNVNPEIIKNVALLERMNVDMEQQLRAVRDKVRAVADTRHKEIVQQIVALEKKHKDAVDSLGSLNEWQEMDEQEAAEIGNEIKRLHAEIDTAVAELNTKIEAITPRAEQAQAEGAFDVKKEKKDLLAKINELLSQAQALGLTEVVTNLNVRKASADRLDKDPGTDAVKEKEIIKIWDAIAIEEVKIYKAQRDASAETEISRESDIDIPDKILLELFSGRQKEVRMVMEAIYTRDLAFSGEGKNDEAVNKAMRLLMDKEPDGAMLKKLRQYGIKNWDSFKEQWDKKLAFKAFKVLHEWGQQDLKEEIAKNTGIKDTLGALKWQMGARIVTNIALVAGGAMAATAIFATGGLAGIALAAAGGAAGGAVRAGLQKLVFGSKWMEDRKQKQLSEMAVRKRQEMINNILDKRFGGKERKDVSGETQIVFASIMAEAIRVATAEAVKGSEQDFSSDEAKSLAGDTKRLYINGLNKAREQGMEPSAEQKVKFAVSLAQIAERGQQTQQEAMAKSDPLVIKMLDGVFTNYSGTHANSEKYGFGSAAKTVALGAGVGMAFFADNTVARGVMGGLGGAALGYRAGESLRNKHELKKAQENITARFGKAQEQWFQFFDDPSSLSNNDLKSFGEEIKKFNRYLHGEADTTDEQAVAAFLYSNSKLKQEVNNLVYQAYRRGLFARISLVELEAHAKEVSADSNIKLADSTKAWLKKTGIRTGSILVGAAVGAGVAVAVGAGVKELREYMGWGPVHPAGGATDILDNKEKLAMGGAIAATQVEHLPVGGAKTGAAEILPTSKTGATEIIPTAKTGIAVEAIKPIDTVTVKSGGSTWQAMEDLHHSKVGKTVFKGWSENDFNKWRHSEMQRLGYVGKAHSFGMDKGAKFDITMDADGKTPHLTPSAKTLDKFYTWDAKGNKVYFNSIDDPSKIDAHYKVEGRIAGKAGGIKEVIAKGELPKVRDVGPNEFKQGYWEKQQNINYKVAGKNLPHIFDDTRGNYHGRSGQAYEPVYSGEDKWSEKLFAFKDKNGNLFDPKTGEYIGTKGTGKAIMNAAVDAVPAKTTWSAGKAIPAGELNRLFNMMHGQGGGSGAVSETVNAAGEKIIEVKGGVGTINRTAAADALHAKAGGGGGSAKKYDWSLPPQPKAEAVGAVGTAAAVEATTAPKLVQIIGGVRIEAAGSYVPKDMSAIQKLTEELAAQQKISQQRLAFAESSDMDKAPLKVYQTKINSFKTDTLETFQAKIKAGAPVAELKNIVAGSPLHEAVAVPSIEHSGGPKPAGAEVLATVDTGLADAKHPIVSSLQKDTFSIFRASKGEAVSLSRPKGWDIQQRLDTEVPLAAKIGTPGGQDLIGKFSFSDKGEPLYTYMDPATKAETILKWPELIKKY